MPELPGEPRLQLFEGCRACGGGANRQKDFLGFLIVWTDADGIRPWTQGYTGTNIRAQAISGAASFLATGASNTHENEYER
jgi:hypothetical protein